MITHANLAANIFQAMIMLDHRPAIGQTALVVTPLYHAAAIWISTFAFASGMSIILHREFDPVRVLDALDARRVSFTFLVPAMISACLLADPDIRSRDWSALDLIMYGASPITEKTLRDALGVFGCRFCQAYGMTETTAILSLLTPADHTRALSECSDLLLSAGRALPGTDIYVVAPDGRLTPPGVMGEIAARGPQIMKGYWNRAEEQAEMMRSGLTHTGDAGVIDNEGYIYLRDRIKDMVVSGGENIYPREVENILFEHPAVADAAVIGIPDAKYGEALLACLVLREGGSLSAEEVVDFCRGRLAGYKIPRKIAVLDALPRNASGKVLKTELRRPYWQGKGRFID
jgi:acyl-CoA synthetase (AMP-forming)/AMP-acid ligase II